MECLGEIKTNMDFCQVICFYFKANFNANIEQVLRILMMSIGGGDEDWK